MPGGSRAGGTVRALIARRRAAAAAGSEQPIGGPVRLGKRTKDLVKRLEPGEVAVIDHADLDRIAAEDLVASGVVAVINADRFSTGRYPNIGPLILARAGIVMLEVAGAPEPGGRDAGRAAADAGSGGGAAGPFELLDDGDVVRIGDGVAWRGDAEILSGASPGIVEVERRLAEQRARIDRALAEFATNTIEHVREESELLTGEVDLPAVRTRFQGRHVLIVVRGSTYREDLAALNAYVRDVRPLIVAVDGGADAVLERGLKPAMILGDMDSASDAALGCGAELVVHAYPDGRAPGCERLQEAGLEHGVLPAAGTSEDVAMLLAHEKGAKLIVAVGAHFNLVEFLDKNRAGMSSTFLTRLRVGETLIDAKGVSRLYRPGIGKAGIAAFALAFLLLAAIVIAASPGLDNVFELLWLKVRDILGT